MAILHLLSGTKGMALLLARKCRSAAGAGGIRELIVVTILVAAEGSFKLGKINSQEQLRTALSILGSINSEDVLAVEVCVHQRCQP